MTAKDRVILFSSENQERLSGSASIGTRTLTAYHIELKTFLVSCVYSIAWLRSQKEHDHVLSPKNEGCPGPQKKQTLLLVTGSSLSFTSSSEPI